VIFKKALSNTFIYAVGPQIPKVFNFLLLPLFTKYLTPVDYGVSGLVYSYTGLVSGLGDLGLHVRYANIFFKYPGQWREKWKHILGILFWWSLLYSVLQAIILYILLPEEIGANKLKIIGLLFITSLIFSTYSGVALRLLQYKEKAMAVSTMNLVIGILSLVLNYYFIIYKRWGYVGWFYTSFITAAVQAVVCLYYLFFMEKIKINIRLQKRYTTKLLLVTTPLILHNYASYLLDSSDRFLMDRFGLSLDTIGLYNFAYIFALYFDFFLSSLGMAVSPMMAKIYYSKIPERKEALKRLLSIIQLGTIALAFIICFFMKEFLELFITNPEFKESYYLVVILVFAYSYKPMYWYINAILTYNNKTGVLWKVTFFAGAFNFVINLILIPYFGVYACCFTTLAAYLFMCIYGFNNNDFRKFNGVSFPYLQYLASIVVLGTISFAAQDLSLVLKLIFFAASVGVVAMFFLKAYRANIRGFNFAQYQ
jgi:O-antigen/teichoic acid export membrane protein